ncbi:MAG: hypothetical protein ABII08_03695, partial [Candidatus Beckwithbacteria bacterium]
MNLIQKIINKRLLKLISWLGVLICISMVLINAKGIIKDINNQKIDLTRLEREIGKEITKEITAEASEIKAEYELIEGWNLVAFPIRPVNFNMASGLVLDVAKKGGYVTVV